jgi:hypothetical protein
MPSRSSTSSRPHEDSKFAARLIDIFRDDLVRSRRISLREWQQRPRAEKLCERAASLFGSQM